MDENEKERWEMFKKYAQELDNGRQQMQPEPTMPPCPNCGRCPRCGRGYLTQPPPYWGPWTVYCRG